jgi:HEAT repeat protein
MMSLAEIQENLKDANPQVRMRGITALKDYEPDQAVPLLIRCQSDREVIIRSFVAMGLGFKRNDQAFETLAGMLKTEADTNVRAEAASALIKYGRSAIPYVVPAFYEYPDWLMRMSIMLALVDMDAPTELFQLCLSAFVDTNPTVRETAVQCLGFLAETQVGEDALLHLLTFASSESWQIRKQVAIGLRRFDDSRAQEMLSKLQQDSDYRVVSAVLDGLWGNA